MSDKIYTDKEKIKRLAAMARSCKQEIAALRSEIANYETARQEDARRLEQVKGELEAMRDALEPFAHPDLCEYLPSNKDGGNSPLFQRNKAVITINDCRQAAAALKDATK